MFTENLIDALNFLVPGFIAAWLYYGITSHKIPGQFERVIQALIFTVIVRLVVDAIQPVIFWLGTMVPVTGQWTQNVELGWSVLVGVILGAAIGIGAEKDWFHALMRYFRVSEKTSFPSVWYSALRDHYGYVVLHLVGGRRLFGWPCEWSKNDRDGHIVISDPIWLQDESGPHLELSMDEGVLVRTRDIEMVEFVTTPLETDDEDQESIS